MKRAVRIGGGVLVAAALLTVLMLWGDVSPFDVLASIRRVPASVYFLALGMHVFTYCMRALRMRLLLPRRIRPGFGRALVISAAHNMASYLLPAKTGEASFVLYLKMHANVPASAGLATLLVARFLDGALLCISLSIACLYLAFDPRYEALEWLGTASGALAVGAVLFLALSARGDLVVRAVMKLMRWVRVHHWELGSRVLERVNEIALALRSEADGRLARGFQASIPMWLSIFGFYTLLSRAMGMPEWIGLPEGAFGAALGMLCNLLPANGVAGVGTQELGWVMGFQQFLGVDYELALSTGMGVHLVQLANIVGLGALAHIAMGVLPGLRGAEGTTP